MQQNILTVCVIEVEDPVVSGAKFPYIIFQMLCNLAWQVCSIVRQEVKVEYNLLILNPSVFVRRAFLAQVLEKIPYVGYTISFLVELNLVHIYSSYRYFDDSIKAISVQGESHESIQ